MAAAVVAAIATSIAIRSTSPEAIAVLRPAGGASVAQPPDEVINVPATAAMGRARVDGDLTAALSSEAVERALAEAPEGRRDLLLGELLARLVSQDAQAAARIAERQVNGYLREAALRTVAQHWTRRDPEAAIAWAVSLGDRDERDNALANAALELAVSRPRLALQALGNRSAAPSPDATLEGVVQQWAMQDFAAAYAWVDAQPAGPDREALLTRLVFARMQQNPADAARIANQAFFVEAQRIAALSTVAHGWGASDPAAVREWALTLDANAQERVRAELALR
jgi:hypothetical protein